MEAYKNPALSPEKLLRKFKRLRLAVGESREVVFTLSFDDFKLLGRDRTWKVEPGEFEIMVGASSEDIRLQTTIEIK